jgi:NUBPL iron-transfer P-loop NTPase
MPILGLVENMGGLVCPHCGKAIPLFSQGGGDKTSALAAVPLLASLPFDLRVVEAADLGKPLLEAPDNSPFILALRRGPGSAGTGSPLGYGARGLGSFETGEVSASGIPPDEIKTLREVAADRHFH